MQPAMPMQLQRGSSSVVPALLLQRLQQRSSRRGARRVMSSASCAVALMSALN